MQRMKLVYLLCLIAMVAFLIWAHTHTDELPIVLGFVLITSGVLAAVFPREFLWTGIAAGGSLFIAETLVYFSVLHAPYPVSRGLPWVALFGYVPAAIGVGIGIAARRITS